MIKLGKLTDYAVVILVQLARETDNDAKSANQLADKTGLPEPTVAKVLKQLSKGGMVESVRGAAGGYRLAKAPRDLSICEVIEAMDGPIAITTCVDDGVCNTGAQCPARGKWTPVNSAIRAALKAVTVADMARTGGAQVIQLTGTDANAHFK